MIWKKTSPNVELIESQKTKKKKKKKKKNISVYNSRTARMRSHNKQTNKIRIFSRSANLFIIYAEKKNRYSTCIDFSFLVRVREKRNHFLKRKMYI
jgi:hypothetical protein